jgi:hypothetical protein
MRKLINLFRLNAWKKRILREEYLKGWLSFLLAFSVLMFITFIGFGFPKQWDNVTFLGKDIPSLGSDLLSGYVGILGVAFAIAATILSILQMAMELALRLIVKSK